MQKLDEWGEFNVFTISGKSQKRMPHKSFEDNFLAFSKYLYIKDKVSDENSVGPSLQWFKENVNKKKMAQFEIRSISLLCLFLWE
jgi:hypothetical protein